MGAKFLCAIFASMLGLVLFRSIRSGKVNWGAGPGSFMAERAKDPAAYWLIMALGFIFFLVMILGVLILPGPALSR